MAYVTYAQFKQITRQKDVDETTEFDEVEPWAEYWVNHDTGNSSWASGDTNYELVQQATAWLCAWMISEGGSNPIPAESMLGERKVGRTHIYLSNYYTIVRRINGTHKMRRWKDVETSRLIEND